MPEFYVTLMCPFAHIIFSAMVEKAQHKTMAARAMVCRHPIVLLLSFCHISLSLGRPSPHRFRRESPGCTHDGVHRVANPTLGTGENNRTPFDTCCIVSFGRRYPRSLPWCRKPGRQSFRPWDLSSLNGSRFLCDTERLWLSVCRHRIWDEDP